MSKPALATLKQTPGTAKVAARRANPLIVALGKTVQAIAGLRGGGSSLPGLVVEKIDRDFAVRLLQGLPYGVIVVSGTNGKTTTTKIVCDLLAGAGIRVFTNNSGSNFMRGVISSLLRSVSISGRLEADIAVLELDEAHAVDFSRRVKPRYALLLNVMRDQLDRFGEIDNTAEMLAEVARNTTRAIVLNREDRRIAQLANSDNLKADVHWFGLSESLKKLFPEDDKLYADDRGGDLADDQGGDLADDRGGDLADDRGGDRSADVVLTTLDGNAACYCIASQCYPVQLTLKGVYNAFNAAAALALVRLLLSDIDAAAISEDNPEQTVPRAHTNDTQLVASLALVTSAFGRGEEFVVGSTTVEFLLVKNPGGFRLALESFTAQGYTTMIAINDDYADGRDMSWLYDVSFLALKESGVAMVSGVRAWDMALRLHYDKIDYAAVQTDLGLALTTFIAINPEQPHRIYCTYTAMLALRRYMSALTNVAKVM